MRKHTIPTKSAQTNKEPKLTEVQQRLVNDFLQQQEVPVEDAKEDAL